MTSPTLNLIQAILREAGSQFVSITFIKKDGSLRQLTGNLKDHNDVKGTGTPTSDPHIVRIRESSKQQWRSFDTRRVVAIKTGGVVHDFTGTLV